MIDPIAASARFLAEHLEWMRHRQDAAEFLTDVDACARIVAGIARGPADDRYRGPCGAPVVIDHGAGITEYTVCEGDMYVREGSTDAVCRTCRATVNAHERELWINEEVRSHAFRASEIANAYGLNVNTIRTWAHDRPGRPARLFPHGHDRDGRPLYNVGEVLDLFREAAVRRAETEARRARTQEPEEPEQETGVPGSRGGRPRSNAPTRSARNRPGDAAYPSSKVPPCPLSKVPPCT